MSREFGDLEDEIEEFSKTDFKVAAQAQKALNELKGILLILRARRIHGKKNVGWKG